MSRTKLCPEHGSHYADSCACCAELRSVPDPAAEITRLTSLVAELREENERLTGIAVLAERTAESARVEMIEWRKAAQTFTPGGSEFMTPQAVIDFVRDRRKKHHEAMCEKVRAEKRAESAERERDAALAEVERVKGAREIHEVSLTVLCMARDAWPWNMPALKDIDIAIEANRAALTPREPDNA